MAPKTRAKSAKAGAKDPNPKQAIQSKVFINTREHYSQNTKRCGHCCAPVRSEDKETTLQDTANAAANVSAAPLDSLEPIDPRESAEVPSPAVLPEWNGRRRRNGLPTEDVELEVADFLVTEAFRRRWASAADDVLVAAATLVQLKKDPNCSAPVQKVSRPKLQPDSTGPPFVGTYVIPI